eukprot:630167-Rhodomonas_salina.2
MTLMTGGSVVPLYYPFSYSLTCCVLPAYVLYYQQTCCTTSYRAILPATATYYQLSCYTTSFRVVIVLRAARY